MNKELVEAIKVLKLNNKELKGCYELHQRDWAKNILAKNDNAINILINYTNNSVPKDKIREILNKLNISDIEPWSTYKVDGKMLFDLKELLEEK